MPKTTVDTGGKPAAQPVEKRGAAESRYSSVEFSRAADTDAALFGKGVTPDIVTAAFFVAGKQEATKAEAKEIVKSFLKGGKK